MVTWSKFPAVKLALGDQGKDNWGIKRGLKASLSDKSKGKRYMIKATNKLPKQLGGLVNELRRPDSNKKMIYHSFPTDAISMATSKCNFHKSITAMVLKWLGIA